MKRLFLFFSILCLFLMSAQHVNAKVSIPETRCTKSTLDGTTYATQTCPIKLKVTEGGTSTYRVNIKVTLNYMQEPIDWQVSDLNTNWHLLSHNGNEFSFVTTLSRIPDGEYTIANITARGTTSNPDNCTGSFTPSFGLKCGATTTGGVTTYYNNEGEQTNYLDYERKCRTHDCDIITDQEGAKIYFNHSGAEITQSQYAIYCQVQRACSQIKDTVTNKTVYFNTEGKETDYPTYIDQCATTKTCRTFVDSNTNTTYYYNSAGNSVIESEFNNDCAEVYCGEKNGKYYDAYGDEVSEVQYKRECLNHSCDKIVDPANNITYYYDKDGNEVSQNKYSLTCEEHQCVEILDTDEQEIIYFGTGKTVVSALDYFKQCKELTCKNYKDINTGTIYYFNSQKQLVNQNKYLEDCGEKVYCDVLNGKYYDKDGKIVDEITYKKQCTNEYRCKIVDNKYYDANGNVITKDEFNKQCVEHVCDTYKDEDNKIHYYNNDGAEVSELEQIKSCKPIICTTYKIGEVTHYFDNKEKEVTKDEYESACLAKPICKEEKGKYYDSEGKEVNKKDYEKSCKKYACQEVDGKYYDSIGAIVSKAIYEVSCNKKDTVENPNTGASIPLRILAFILILGISIYSFAVKHNKIMRVK